MIDHLRMFVRNVFLVWFNLIGVDSKMLRQLINVFALVAGNGSWGFINTGKGFLAPLTPLSGVKVVHETYDA
mgnify:CR=1 FL=1